MLWVLSRVQRLEDKPMNISVTQAKNIAEEIVNKLAVSNDDEFALIDDETTEIAEGWLFFYNSRDFIETGNPGSCLVGNGPIFVNREGVVRRLPSAVSWQTAIADDNV
jgi:hypothetical protein